MLLRAFYRYGTEFVPLLLVQSPLPLTLIDGIEALINYLVML
jgi:hypothetical protein